MKIVKRLLATMLIVTMLLTTVSCYFVSGQKMKNVKGTYKLTHYSYTPSYERKEGYTPKTRDYVGGEEYLYEDYLIITGASTGYYVHKAVGVDPYVKEITLSYEYDDEDSSKVEYVIYNDAISINENSGIHRLGVTKNNLNYTKNAFDYTELFTKRQMRSEAISVRWEKVDDAIDISFAIDQIGNLKIYGYKAFSVRGIYELGSPTEIETGSVIESKYQYFFYVIDTADNGISATVCYALKDSPNEKITESVTISKGTDDWSVITVDGKVWTLDQLWANSYYIEDEGLKYSLNHVSYNISDKILLSLVESRIP
jgi:hypothetical protein